MAGDYRVAGFSGNGIFIMVGTGFQQTVLLRDRQGILVLVGGRDGVTGGGVNIQIGWFLNGCSHNQRHIIGGCRVVFIVQTRWIREMGILAAKFFGFLVHQNREVFDASGDMLG